MATEQELRDREQSLIKQIESLNADEEKIRQQICDVQSQLKAVQQELAKVEKAASYLPKVTAFLSEAEHCLNWSVSKGNSMKLMMTVLADGGFDKHIKDVDSDGQIHFYRSYTIPEENKIDFFILNAKYIVLRPWIHDIPSVEPCYTLTATEYKKDPYFNDLHLKAHETGKRVVLKCGIIAHLLDKPVELRVQTDHDTNYGYGGNQYGDTTSFYIVATVSDNSIYDKVPWIWNEGWDYYEKMTRGEENA